MKTNIYILSESLSEDYEWLEGSGFGEVKNLINLAQISGRDIDITMVDLPCQLITFDLIFPHTNIPCKRKKGYQAEVGSVK